MKKILLFILPVALLLISCDEIIMEDDISDETVVLVAPYDNAVVNSTSITFTWDAIENGSQYRIQIARPNFESPIAIVTDQVIDTTSYTVQLNVGQYQWRVKGLNSAYETAYTTRNLTIASNEDFQNNSVTLISPQNNLITNTPVQTLSWQTVLGATGYHLQILSSDDSSVEYEQDITTTSFDYNFNEGNYTWRVRATNGSANTLYFSRSILTDFTAPNIPALSLPTNGSSSSDNDVSFQWTRSALSGSTETDSIYVYSNSGLTNLYYKGLQTSPYNATSLPSGTYYWYVKGFDTAGNQGQQSNTFSFTLN